MIRVLAIGDVMGKAGRKCLAKLLPIAREQFNPDIVLANGENAAGGFGITKKIFNQFIDQFGIDCVTTGNHWADKKEIHQFLDDTQQLLIPANMMNVSSSREEKSYTILETKKGVRYAVINLIGRAFMNPDNRNPLETARRIFDRIPESVKIRVLDMHAEATSEKQAIAHFLTPKVSLVYGTHSHVPTADERIINKHTGFATDIGMTGAYDSVIGVRKEASIERLLTGQAQRFEPAVEDPWMCFIVADIDERSGACQNIQRFRWELDKMTSDPANDSTSEDAE